MEFLPTLDGFGGGGEGGDGEGGGGATATIENNVFLTAVQGSGGDGGGGEGGDGEFGDGLGGGGEGGGDEVTESTSRPQEAAAAAAGAYAG